MKKIIAIVLSLLAVASIFAFASCGKDDVNNDEKVPAVADATELLTKVWAAYAEEEKFAAIGGDFGAPVDNAPGKYNIADEGLATSLVFPADAIAQIDDAASLIHMMNANTFTAGAFHAVEGTDVAALAESIKTTVLNNHWMCGFPEKLVIFTVDGDYIVSAFGAADLISNFEAKLTATYPEAVLAASENLAA